MLVIPFKDASVIVDPPLPRTSATLLSSVPRRIRVVTVAVLLSNLTVATVKVVLRLLRPGRRSSSLVGLGLRVVKRRCSLVPFTLDSPFVTARHHMHRFRLYHLDPLFEPVFYGVRAPLVVAHDTPTANLEEDLPTRR